MVHKQDITVGRYYVNHERKVARKITDVGALTVTFHTYHLDTGNSCGSPSECAKMDFKRWMDREASPAEIASLHDRELEALLRSPYPTNRDVSAYGLNTPTRKTTLNVRVAPPRLTGADRTQIFA